MMNSQSIPSVSVIIPTYNRSGFVRDCLGSLRQSGIPDLEIIVSDDGSTDDTREVVAATEPDAKYIWQKNTGTPSTARNKGFAISRGRYVCFLDCDDAWLPEVPGRAAALLDRHPEVDVLFAEAHMGNPEQGYASWIESSGKGLFFDLPHREVEPGFRILDRIPFFGRMAHSNPVFSGATLLRREAFETCGPYDPNLCGAADWELWLRMAYRLTWGYLSEPMAIYTRHLNNMSSDSDGMIRDFCLALRGVLAKCDLAPTDRKQIRTRLQDHLFNYAYAAYDSGRLSEARPRFSRVLREGGPLKAAFFWLACCLPAKVARKLRQMKQAFSH